MTRLAGLVLLFLIAAVADAGDPALAVSLVIPSDDGVARVNVSDPKAHFHVLLRNQSATPVRVWDSTFSWGYYALSLELVDEKGTRRVVRRKQTAFTRNIARAWLLEPEGYVVLNVFLGRPGEWEGLPELVSDCLLVQMTAVYDVASDAESRKQSVWTGRVTSRTRQVSLCK